jgi:large subunit ribosomal protein L6
MSRKGKMPIVLPKGIEIEQKGNSIVVKGPKGQLSQEIHSEIALRIEEGVLHVEPKGEVDREISRQHGLARSLIQNMVLGTSVGFLKKLELIGVGYRAALKGKMLDLQLGFSHPTELLVPEGLTIAIEKNTLITISGIDKREVGQFAAVVRGMKKPEPYQGKGIRYSGEAVRRKAGKSGKK